MDSVRYQTYERIKQNPSLTLEEAMSPYEGRERGWVKSAWYAYQSSSSLLSCPKEHPERVPYEEFDPETVELCRLLNSFPGIQTSESCCGHGKTSFYVLFKVSQGDLRGLFMLARCVDPRYWKHGHQWGISLSVGDVPHKPLPVRYLLQSPLSLGERAYAQAESLVRNIEKHRRHRNFLVGYGLEELAAPGVLVLCPEKTT